LCHKHFGNFIAGITSKENAVIDLLQINIFWPGKRHTRSHHCQEWGPKLTKIGKLFVIMVRTQNKLPYLKPNQWLYIVI